MHASASTFFSDTNLNCMHGWMGVSPIEFWVNMHRIWPAVCPHWNFVVTNLHPKQFLISFGKTRFLCFSAKKAHRSWLCITILYVKHQICSVEKTLLVSGGWNCGRVPLFFAPWASISRFKNTYFFREGLGRWLIMLPSNFLSEILNSVSVLKLLCGSGVLLGYVWF